MTRLAPLLLASAALLGAAETAIALEVGKYHFEPGGRIESVRTLDVDADGRPDLVALVTKVEEGVESQFLLVLRTPAHPRPGAFYGDGDVARIPVDDGDLRAAGAVAVGHFGPRGEARLRFLTRTGIHDLTPAGEPAPTEDRLRLQTTLLGRSADRPLVFWDQHGDLDGDGVEEIWFPEGGGNGVLRIASGRPGGDRTLDFEAENRGVTDFEHLVRRHAYVPNLEPADLDGDGRLELVAFRSPRLVVWPYDTEGPREAVRPAFTLDLPFVKEHLEPDEVHTPRLELIDIDRDGTTDLIVTLVTGDRRQIGSFRTRLLHFPGPFRDAATGALVPPRVRIDTESVALHTQFVDLDGDGDLDYVTDAIRGTKVDLIKRLFGQAPTTWYVGFRFEKKLGTFETVPYFSLERPYAIEEAVGNRFGRTGYFEGDFDGDGHRDLLDLGDLTGLEILKAAPKRGAGPGDPVVFEQPIVPRVRVPSPLVADAVVADLYGDGTADAFLWTEDTVYLVVTRGAR